MFSTQTWMLSLSLKTVFWRIFWYTVSANRAPLSGKVGVSSYSGYREYPVAKDTAAVAMLDEINNSFLLDPFVSDLQYGDELLKELTIDSCKEK